VKCRCDAVDPCVAPDKAPDAGASEPPPSGHRNEILSSASSSLPPPPGHEGRHGRQSAARKAQRRHIVTVAGDESAQDRQVLLVGGGKRVHGLLGMPPILPMTPARGSALVVPPGLKKPGYSGIPSAALRGPAGNQVSYFWPGAPRQATCAIQAGTAEHASGWVRGCAWRWV
jgi:hypothetical protein